MNLRKWGFSKIWRRHRVMIFIKALRIIIILLIRISKTMVQKMLGIWMNKFLISSYLIVSKIKLIRSISKIIVMSMTKHNYNNYHIIRQIIWNNINFKVRFINKTKLIKSFKTIFQNSKKFQLSRYRKINMRNKNWIPKMAKV